MDNQQQKWIEETESSADALQRLSASPLLFEGVKQRIHYARQNTPSLSGSTVWLAAAAIAALVTINIVTLKNIRTASQSVAAESGSPYSLTDNSFNIYP